MSDATYSNQVLAFANAGSLDALPGIVDVGAKPPLNPPEQIQVKFVGLAYADAYAEAESFVAVADEFAAKHGGAGFAELDQIADFGAGWGRITRTLLTRVAPAKIYAMDIDAEMTALLNVTLPGVNTLTVTPQPPTVLGDASLDALVAFSVFSHLSGRAHAAWAAEIGRLVKPGGVVAITVLDHAFFGQIAGAKAAVAGGEADEFAKHLAETFDDLDAARRGYDAGEIQYAGTGGGEVRTADSYGWAAAPAKYMKRVWGDAGFHVTEWVPSGVLFQQALVFLVRQPSPAGAAAAMHRVARSSRVRSLLTRVRPALVLRGRR